jgi:hypothetical protein
LKYGIVADHDIHAVEDEKDHGLAVFITMVRKGLGELKQDKLVACIAH